MISKKINFALFTILCIVQLYVAMGMISQNESVIRSGKEFRFRTAPVDPIDPLRGKFINLNFADNAKKVNDARDWHFGDLVFATFREDSSGMAVIDLLEKEKPSSDDNYLEVRIINVIDSPDEQTVFVEFPFNRFYLEEKQAPKAEKIYLEALADEQANTYAIVYIKDGQAVLTDVKIGSRSLKGD